MARPRRQPTIKRRSDGRYILEYTDAATGRRVRQLTDAPGTAVEPASSVKARKALLAKTMVEQRDAGAEVRRRGGQLAYDTPLLAALAKYSADVEARAALRQQNPASREGLSKAAAKELRDTLARFRDWLAARHPRLTTGMIDAPLVRSYFAALASTPTRRGSREVLRSGGTVNKYRSGMRACFRWLAQLRPPLFPDFPALASAFKLRRADSKPPRAYTPGELRSFYRCACERENPLRLVKVHRVREFVAMPDGRFLPGDDTTFEQGAPSKAAVPVSRLFLLLALTGCRLSEALALRWRDCDLTRGRLTIHSTKTGRHRILPLVGDAAGDIAPGLLALLRAWRLEAGDREYVLPHPGLAAPTFPKGAWAAVARAAGVAINPQALRQSWVSYAAALGVPELVSSLWAGHASAVAARFYRAQAIDRLPGASSFEAAMGLAEIAGANIPEARDAVS